MRRLQVAFANPYQKFYSVFGFFPKELTTDLRQKIGSNKGMLVFAVRKGSPAFQADILAGDIVKKIGDIEMIDLKSVDDAAGVNACKQVTILLLRDGKEITKEIQCDSLPY
jgi:S1-C subfamily serine protease